MLTDKLLWDAYARTGGSQPDIPDEGHLLFPCARNNKLRVSEQEARFAFVEALCRRSLRYSIETPTKKDYQFTGNTPISAQTDLSVYDMNGKSSICNIEFKAHGASKENPSIKKDVEKLLREPEWGLWFHIMEGVNNSTINKLMRVMASCINQVRDKHEKDIDTPGLTFHICVLRHGFSLHKDVPLDLTDAELRKYLNVNLVVSQNELKKVIDRNEWKLNQVDMHRQ